MIWPVCGIYHPKLPHFFNVGQSENVDYCFGSKNNDKLIFVCKELPLQLQLNKEEVDYLRDIVKYELKKL